AASSMSAAGFSPILMESAIVLPSMAHLASRLILIASSALFMASPVKKRGRGAVDSGQSSATARGFASCSFFDCAPGKGNYLQQKQGSGIRGQAYAGCPILAVFLF